MIIGWLSSRNLNRRIDLLHRCLIIHGVKMNDIAKHILAPPCHFVLILPCILRSICNRLRVPSHGAHGKILILLTLSFHLLLLHGLSSQCSLNNRIASDSTRFRCLRSLKVTLFCHVLLQEHHVITVELSLIEREDSFKLVQTVFCHLDFHLLSQSLVNFRISFFFLHCVNILSICSIALANSNCLCRWSTYRCIFVFIESLIMLLPNFIKVFKFAHVQTFQKECTRVFIT